MSAVSTTRTDRPRIATVSTARVIDPRIEPQPNPTYAVTIGPKQNQFYKIPASGLSDSYITFNNLTTLGADRAYLDTFELEIEAEITFHVDCPEFHTAPSYNGWTFDSFPFNKCCEEVRVNINGGAFFSQPLSYLRAKERYWDEKAITSSYENICPCSKPHMQNEVGLFQHSGKSFETWAPVMQSKYFLESDSLQSGGAVPTRCGEGVNYYMPCASGIGGGWNNAIVPEYTPAESGDVTVVVTWREPVFASPFSSRIDATYGRPLYNITSMDVAFNLQDLGNMIRVIDTNVQSYEVHIRSCQLCYQVMTVPLDLAPSYTVVPYRRFVPYITDCPQNPLPSNIAQTITMTSGVYTLNEIPTAIWIFFGPTKRHLQTNYKDGFPIPKKDIVTDCYNTWSNNKEFGFLQHLSISMANTTQILNTAEPPDLYRIAKANGCKDSFLQWGRWNPVLPKSFMTDNGQLSERLPYCGGPGSVLRLIPGTDLIIPDQDLVPGANANNMVFQVTGEWSLPPLLENCRDYALWVLFEYVGVATITPGQCEITMNPLGDGRSMNSAPVVSTTPSEPTSETEGSGWLDKLKQFLSAANTVAKKTGVIGTALGMIPGVGPMLRTAARSIGYGEPKRRRVGEYEGGAVMGLGDFC